MRLTHGGRLPILDGELRIEELHMENLGTRDFSVRLWFVPRNFLKKVKLRLLS
jgi:hypothetical protein